MESKQIDQRILVYSVWLERTKPEAPNSFHTTVRISFTVPLKPEVVWWSSNKLWCWKSQIIMNPTHKLFVLTLARCHASTLWLQWPPFWRIQWAALKKRYFEHIEKDIRNQWLTTDSTGDIANNQEWKPVKIWYKYCISVALMTTYWLKGQPAPKKPAKNF